MNNSFELFSNISLKNSLILSLLYVAVAVSVVFLVRHLIFVYKFRKANANVEDKRILVRYQNNPIITPKPYSKWESVGTFNPAALKDNDGVVHLLYRAIGDDGASRIGHSKSSDGLTFTEKSPYPVYTYIPSPKSELEFARSSDSLGSLNSSEISFAPKYYDPGTYTSGGSWGGSEDPRLVSIEGRVYMTFTAFEGWNSVRIAITSISMEDFKASKWNWKKPKFLSSSTEVNKNWVLFPEKINGKFAILHGISPEIKISYIDDLDSYENNIQIKSSAPSGGREGSWDNWMRGAGSPPIRTEIGWLLLYHAMDKNDPNKYKVGCMILDFKDPTHVLYRGSKPLLEPDAPYENDGKPGVVYVSGTVIMGDDLLVYYGGGDKNVCVAKTPLKPLLNWLKRYGKV